MKYRIALMTQKYPVPRWITGSKAYDTKRALMKSNWGPYVRKGQAIIVKVLS